MAEYGIILAKNSFVGHVENADPSQLAIDTRLLVPRIVSRGSGVVTSVTSGTLPVITIPHGLDYPPDCEVFMGVGANRQILNATAIDGGIPFIIGINGTNLIIEQLNYEPASGQVYNYYYYIFDQEAIA